MEVVSLCEKRKAKQSNEYYTKVEKLVNALDYAINEELNADKKITFEHILLAGCSVVATALAEMDPELENIGFRDSVFSAIQRLVDERVFSKWQEKERN